MRIGHTSIDERGKAKGGSAGDQNGKEVCIRNYYIYRGGWDFVLRCVDSSVADKMALICEAGCNNPNIGYNQNNRNSLYKQFLTAKSLGGINVKCDTDCSAFMTVCAIAAGINIQYGFNAPTTSTMKRVFKNTGKLQCLYEKEYLTSNEYLKRGDILVKEGHHTIMILDNGARAYEAPLTKKVTDVSDYPTLQNGAKGSLVKTLQTLLNKHGSRLTVDGSFGPATKNAVVAYQKLNGLVPDGIVGKNTWNKLVND